MQWLSLFVKLSYWKFLKGAGWLAVTCAVCFSQKCTSKYQLKKVLIVLLNILEQIHQLVRVWKKDFHN